VSLCDDHYLCRVGGDGGGEAGGVVKGTSQNEKPWGVKYGSPLVYGGNVGARGRIQDRARNFKVGTRG